MAIVITKRKSIKFERVISKETIAGEPQVPIVQMTAELDEEKKVATFSAPYIMNTAAYAENRSEVRAALNEFENEVYAEEDKLYI